MAQPAIQFRRRSATAWVDSNPILSCMNLTLSTAQDVGIARSRKIGKREFAIESGSEVIFSYEPYVWLPSSSQAGIAAQFTEFSQANLVNLNGNLQDNGIALTMAAETGAGNPTGGDVSNRLEVFLTYTILELSG